MILLGFQISKSDTDRKRWTIGECTISQSDSKISYSGQTKYLGKKSFFCYGTKWSVMKRNTNIRSLSVPNFVSRPCGLVVLTFRAVFTRTLKTPQEPIFFSQSFIRNTSVSVSITDLSKYSALRLSYRYAAKDVSRINQGMQSAVEKWGTTPSSR